MNHFHNADFGTNDVAPTGTAAAQDAYLKERNKQYMIVGGVIAAILLYLKFSKKK